MKLINQFVRRFNVALSLSEDLVVKSKNRYFLLNVRLKKLVSKGFFYAGVYLGKVKNGVFFPSFALLSMVAEKEGANKVVVDRKTEWLFICGRDIFKQGIVGVAGSSRRGDYTLVVNEHG